MGLVGAHRQSAPEGRSSCWLSVTRPVHL